MKKVFLSYSIKDSEEVLIPLLSRKLREKGFHVITSQNFFGGAVDYTTLKEIDKANLFFGVISKNTDYSDRVTHEWEYAKTTGTPSIFLVEHGIRINSNFEETYVRFDRHNPQKAINEINKKMETSEDNNSAWPWIIGGAVALGLISLLSNNDD